MYKDLKPALGMREMHYAVDYEGKMLGKKWDRTDE
jgi:hypothetical protein